MLAGQHQRRHYLRANTPGGLDKYIFIIFYVAVYPKPQTLKPETLQSYLESLGHGPIKAPLTVGESWDQELVPVLLDR